jgi:hypothetical protein
VVVVPGRPGVAVRARKGYFAPDDRIPRDAPGGRAEAVARTRRIEEIRGALTALVPPRELPVRMSVDYIHTGAGSADLVLSAHVDLSGLRFDRVGDRDRAEVEVLGVVYDAKGDVVGEFKPEEASLDLEPPSAEEARAEGLRYKRSAALEPGAYQVRVVARGARHSQLGSASDWVEIPRLRGGSLELSSLFLFAGPPADEAAGAPEAARLPSRLRDVQALRRFRRGESLYYELYAHAPAREGGAAEVVVQSQVWSGGELLGVSPQQPVPFTGKGPEPATLSGSIALRDLAPGAYELRILVVDRKSPVTALRRSGFTLE